MWTLKNVKGVAKLQIICWKPFEDKRSLKSLGSRVCGGRPPSSFSKNILNSSVSGTYMVHFSVYYLKNICIVRKYIIPKNSPTYQYLVSWHSQIVNYTKMLILSGITQKKSQPSTSFDSVKLIKKNSSNIFSLISIALCKLPEINFSQTLKMPNICLSMHFLTNTGKNPKKTVQRREGSE